MKLTMFILAGMVASTLWAGKLDVYDVKMTCRVPVIRNEVKEYKTTSFQGVAGFEYDETGFLVNPVPVVLVGDFDGDGGKECVSGEMDVGSLLAIGKNGKKASCSAGIGIGNLSLSCSGEGTCRDGLVQGCGPIVVKTVDTLNCTVAGTCSDIVDECGDSCSYPFNCFSDCSDVETPFDACTGTMKFRFNKKLTTRAACQGFESVLP